MRYRVNIADAHLVNRNTRVIGRDRHPLTCLDIFGVLNRLLQPSKDPLHCKPPVFFASAPVPNTDIGLDPMGQSVNASRSSHRRRQAE